MLVRAIFIALAIAGGTGIGLYAIGWLCIRSENESDSIASRFISETRSSGSWVGIALIFVAVLIILDNISFIRGGVIWAAALIIVGLLLYWGDLPRLLNQTSKTDESKEGVQPMTSDAEDQARHAAMVVDRPVEGPGSPTTPPPPPPTRHVPTPPILPPPAPPRERSILGRLTLGVMAIALGVLALLDNTTSLVDPQPRHYLALGVTVLGIGLLVGALIGRARWLALIGLLVLPFLFGSPALEYRIGDWQSVDISEAPTSFDDLDGFYEQSVGEMVIDLTELPWDGQQREVTARLDVGHLVVILPDEVAVTGQAEASIGQVRVDSDWEAGLSRSIFLDEPGDAGTLNLYATVGAGGVTIDRVPADQ